MPFWWWHGLAGFLTLQPPAQSMLLAHKAPALAIVKLRLTVKDLLNGIQGQTCVCLAIRSNSEDFEEIDSNCYWAADAG